MIKLNYFTRIFWSLNNNGLFPATEVLVDKYNQMSTPGPFPKHWLGFSYIRSEYFDLYQNFDDM